MLALRPVSKIEAERRVIDHRNNFSGWDWSALEGILPPTLLFQMAAIHVYRAESERDKQIWRKFVDGRFSVKSAYNLAAGIAADMSLNWKGWDLVWSLKV